MSGLEYQRMPPVKRAPKPAAEDFLAFAHRLADLSGAAILPYFRRSGAVKNKQAGVASIPSRRRTAPRSAPSARRSVPLPRPRHRRRGVCRGRRCRALPVADRSHRRHSRLHHGQPPVGHADRPCRSRQARAGHDGPALHARALLGRRASGAHARPGWHDTPYSRRAVARALADAVLTSTHPDLFAAPGEQARFDRVKARVRMTRYGGDCYGYCLLAAGFVDIVVEVGIEVL